MAHQTSFPLWCSLTIPLSSLGPLRFLTQVMSPGRNLGAYSHPGAAFLRKWLTRGELCPGTLFPSSCFVCLFGFFFFKQNKWPGSFIHCLGCHFLLLLCSALTPLSICPMTLSNGVPGTCVLAIITMQLVWGVKSHVQGLYWRSSSPTWGAVS